MRKSINEIRENQLRALKDRSPNGSKRIAEAAISALPYSALKVLTEALGIEDECQKIKKATK